MRKNRRNRKLKKNVYRAKDLSVLTALVELKEEKTINGKRILKRYYICLKDSGEYYHLSSKKKIINTMEDKFYNIICIQTISEFTDYMEDGEMSLADKEDSLIDANEIFKLEDILNLVANID